MHSCDDTVNIPIRKSKITKSGFAQAGAREQDSAVHKEERGGRANAENTSKSDRENRSDLA